MRPWPLLSPAPQTVEIYPEFQPAPKWRLCRHSSRLPRGFTLRVTTAVAPISGSRCDATVAGATAALRFNPPILSARSFLSDRALAPREILSSALARGSHTIFHIAVTVPPKESYFLYVVPNPVDAWFRSTKSTSNARPPDGLPIDSKNCTGFPISAPSPTRTMASRARPRAHTCSTCGCLPSARRTLPPGGTGEVGVLDCASDGVARRGGADSSDADRCCSTLAAGRARHRCRRAGCPRRLCGRRSSFSLKLSGTSSAP